MARLTFALLLPALAIFVGAAPIPSSNAKNEANIVFVDSFPADLSTGYLGTMREAAEDAETDQLNPQIDVATGADGTSMYFQPPPVYITHTSSADALQVGKIKNKVLKLTGEVQQLKIKIAIANAAGEDTSDLESSLADERTKLTTNIATDVKSKCVASKGVA
ncbi:hypothetical protein C8R43DRAFT_1090099 [Mycena crocata]|nr:hypothetical protein C8R43DRAFT_1090099 [Mycena crocata]